MLSFSVPRMNCSALRAAEFFAEVIQNRLQRGRGGGDQFRFRPWTRRRHGDADTTRRTGGNTSGGCTAGVVLDGIEVSSSRIRSALLAGNVREAATLLGAPIGSTDWSAPASAVDSSLASRRPTWNSCEPSCPETAFMRVRVPHEGTMWPAAANVGPNPTFGEDARKVEVHLIGFQGDLYGQSLAVDFVERLRDTRRFKGVTELVEQLGQDIEAVRRTASQKPEAMG